MSPRIEQTDEEPVYVFDVQTGADLTRANLSRANLNEAGANQHTRWPEGFDPVAAGVTFE